MKYTITQHESGWLIVQDGQAVDKWGQPSVTPQLYWSQSRAQYACNFLNERASGIPTNQADESLQFASNSTTETELNEPSKSIRPSGNKRRNKGVQTDDSGV